MEHWINAAFLEADQLLPVAQAAEELGFDGITMPDHLFLPEQFDSRYPYSSDGEVVWPPEAPWPDCWVAIGAMASVTHRLRFGTSVYLGPLRDTLSLAKAVGTCAALAPGRIMCGLGAGWLREEYEVVGKSFASRGKRLDEMIDALPLLWSGELVEYDGEHVSFPRLRMRPPAPGIPILIGGNSTPALRRAAKADGWIGAFTNLAELSEMLDEFEAHRAKHGRSHTAREILVTATPGIAKHVDRLSDLGVDAVVIPAVTLSESNSIDDVIVGLERYAARRS